jgi:hypothetical protein
MTERELEQRLQAAALALDALAPEFDAARLPTVRRPRMRPLLAVAAGAAVLAGVAVQPAALSAVARFLGVTSVEELAPRVDVAPPHLGRAVSGEAAAWFVAFPLREITALGEPERFYGREDVGGGMVSMSYAGGVVFTQWSAEAVDASVEVIATRGVAEDAAVGSSPAMWIAGEARGTFVVVGADGELHREAFDVRDGVLAWEAAGVGFLLRGASSKADAVRLAASVD